mgnify:CR=1 FL=1
MASMSSPTYRIEITEVSGPRLRLRVTAANHSGQTVPTEGRFPLLALCECYQVMAGLSRFLPDGWTLPAHVNAKALVAEHPYADVLKSYSLEETWVYPECERWIEHPDLIRSVHVEGLGVVPPDPNDLEPGEDPASHTRATGTIVAEFADPALLRHAVPGTHWLIYWW